MDEALEVARQIGEGLEAAHERGITHGNLKSDNIMVTEKGQPRILEFGIPLPTGKGAAPVADSPYLAPEVQSGSASDESSDIFSLGVILFEAATWGRLPSELTGAGAFLAGSPPAPSAYAGPVVTNLRLLMLVVYVGLFASIWDLGLYALAQAVLGEHVARVLIDVTITALIAYAIWGVASAAVDRLAGPEPEEGGMPADEPGAGGKTRMETILPLFKKFLGGTILVNANLKGADLERANLWSATLVNAKLEDADLRKANLTDADLADAWLAGADLTKATLRNSNLVGARLDGAILDGANLAGATR